ncbi:MAG: hypothetical protein ACPGJR_03245 [Akkermansiaceae bacterium]
MEYVKGFSGFSAEDLLETHNRNTDHPMVNDDRQALERRDLGMPFVW